MIGMNSHISIISLNVNGLNAPLKRHRMTKWIKYHQATIYCLQETHLTRKDIHRLKVRGWETNFQANGTQKKGGVVILISDKIPFKLSKI